MRHRKAGKRLGRTWEHRKAMFRNMARALLTHEQIRTTETKAKELRKLADRLITFGLANDLNARRKAYKVLENHRLVKKLFDEIAPRYSDVSGGYTRVIKLGVPRRGDAAPMAMIELVAPEAVEPAPKKKPAKKAAKKEEAAASEKGEAPAGKKAEDVAPEEASPSEEAAQEEATAEAEPTAEAEGENAATEESAVAEEEPVAASNKESSGDEQEDRKEK